MTTTLRPLAVVTALALAVTACGSDSQGSRRDQDAPTGDVGNEGEIGPGVTDSEILVGRFYTESPGEIVEELGVATVDERDYDQVLVDDINRQGGVAGRSIEINYVATNPNEATDALEQRACTSWTQDSQVFAVLAGGTENLKGCLTDSGVPMLDATVFSNSDRETFEEFPTYVELNALDYTRSGKALIDGAEDQGFFDGDVKIGLISLDEPVRRRAVEESVKPTLADHGLRFDEENYVLLPQGPEEQADALASIPAVVLRFKSAGINRVIVFGDVGGGLAGFFSRSASEQNYQPRYAVTSESPLQPIIETGLVPAEQFRGSLIVGWNPLGDIGDRPHVVRGPGYERCIDLFNEAGIRPEQDTNTHVIALNTCDYWWSFKAAVEAGLPSITDASFIDGIESLGTSYEPATTYSTRFGPGQHSGVGAVRYATFDESCECFMYTSDENQPV